MLGTVRLQTIPSGLILDATDLEIYMRQALDGEVLGRVECLVDGKLLAQAVKSTTGKEVDLAQEDKILKVNGVVELDASTPLDEYPLRPEFMPSEDQVIFPGQEIADMYRRTQFAAAKDMSCYAYNGLLFEARGVAVATDGRRLAMSSTGTGPDTWEAVIPKKAFEIAAKSVDKKGEVKVDQWKNLVRFLDESKIEIMARKMEGDFPKYRDVIPDGSKIVEVNLDREGFQSAIEQAVSLNKSKEVKTVEIIFDEAGGTRIFSEVEGVGKLDVNITAYVPSSRQDLIGTFNPDFILDFLKSLAKPGSLKSQNTMEHEHAQLTMGLQPGKKEQVNDAVTLQDPDDPNQGYILMPIAN